MDTMMLMTAAGVVVAVQVFAWWRQHLALRAIVALDRRLAAHDRALTLLTETAESGFTAMGREIDRLAAPPSAPSSAPRRAPRTRRPAAPPIEVIAADEGVSQGEVALRMRLAGGRTRKEPKHGAVRL
jgi:hypothetical protein